MNNHKHKPIDTPSKACIKRLTRDIKNIEKEPIDNIKVYVDDKNILIWYFKIFAPKDDINFKNGEYIGKIIFHPKYPFKAPKIMMITPNGRFAVNKYICLSNTSYHADQWSPLWKMESILVGFYSIMFDNNKTHGIAHISSPPEVKKQYAKKSKCFNMTLNVDKYL